MTDSLTDDTNEYSIFKDVLANQCLMHKIENFICIPKW